MSELPSLEKMGKQQAFENLNIVADRNIRGAEHTFARHGQVTYLDGREISPEHLELADALIIRTATRVDRQLLQHSRVRFVGTTSIGTDHIDTAYLDENDIRWSSAPGCNADSASQYTLAMIWLACQKLGRKLSDLNVGIIGKGNVGSRLMKLLEVMNVRCVANDPPLAEQGIADLVSLDQALRQDIVSLHVPLERSGPYPTHQFIGADQLAEIPDRALLVNAARGDVLDGDALLRELRIGRLHAALDVWPGEPFFSDSLLELATVATPHIAGYSEEGKRNGTWMVYQAFRKWAGLAPVKRDTPDLPAPVLEVKKGCDALSNALDSACFVGRHDREMRRLVPLDAGQRAVEFDRLRREYPTRRDFQAWTILCPDPDLHPQLREMGFTLIANE